MSNIREIPLNKGDKEMADILRDYAEQVESGEIQNFIFCARYCGQNTLERWGAWQDRWELIGALEYAKAIVLGLEPSASS